MSIAGVRQARRKRARQQHARECAQGISQVVHFSALLSVFVINHQSSGPGSFLSNGTGETRVIGLYWLPPCLARNRLSTQTFSRSSRRLDVSRHDVVLSRQTVQPPRL